MSKISEIITIKSLDIIYYIVFLTKFLKKILSVFGERCISKKCQKHEKLRFTIVKLLKIFYAPSAQ